MIKSKCIFTTCSVVSMYKLEKQKYEISGVFLCFSWFEVFSLWLQFLLGGLVIDADDNVAMQDQEMASMRQGRAFLTLLNDNIPKTITAMETLLEDLESQEMALSQSRFESLLFGTVYSAYKVKGHQGAEEQQAWTQLLVNLCSFLHPITDRLQCFTLWELVLMLNHTKSQFHVRGPLTFIMSVFPTVMEFNRF
uniref:Uncharacterized protein n=1 Tax=Denticeps clupeoides TaxID=299321 RepID=A0AAY4BS99_9TELE